MKKKLLAGILVAGLAVSLVACGGKAEEAASSAAEAASSAAAAASSAVEEAAEAASSAVSEAAEAASSAAASSAAEEEEVAENINEAETEQSEWYSNLQFATSEAADGWTETDQFLTDKDPSELFIGLSDINNINSWRAEMFMEVECMAEEIGCKVVTADAGGDAQKQISDIQDMIAQGVDGLLIAPASTTATIDVQKEAIAQGIPVFCIDTTTEDKDSYTGYVAANNQDMGHSVALWLLEKMDYKGKIVIFSGMAGTMTSDQRDAGLYQAIEETGADIEILAQYWDDWSYDTAKQDAEKALAAYPEIDGVFSQGGAMSQGVLEAFEAAGRDLPPITGEANNGFLKFWYNHLDAGMESAAFSCPTKCSSIAFNDLLNALYGKGFYQDHIVLGIYVTNDNLEDYVRTDLIDDMYYDCSLPQDVLEEHFSV